MQVREKMMSDQHWRMTVYDLGADASYTVPERVHAFAYAEQGQVSVKTAGGVQAVETGDGVFPQIGATIGSTGNAWLFEIGRTGMPVNFGSELSPVISRIAVLADGAHILRADRVESQAGAQTPSHRHRGPGVRRLERGLLRAEVGDHLDRIGAGGAWFETQHESVVGTNISCGVNVFVRVMLLPAELAGGKSSFVATTPADAAKPRAVNLRLFGEQPLV
jgi:hypothetical protein